VVNYATSGYVSVCSGAPQWAVVGPTLFLAYTNDLPKQLTSKTRLLAYDTAASVQTTTSTNNNSTSNVWEAGNKDGT